jgi:hypothetical protein
MPTIQEYAVYYYRKAGELAMANSSQVGGVSPP